MTRPTYFQYIEPALLEGCFLSFLIEKLDLYPNLFSCFNLVIHPCQMVKLGTVVFQLIEFVRSIYSAWIGCLIFFYTRY